MRASDEILPITVVSASRYGERDFLERSALGRSIAQAYSNYPVSWKIYFDNVSPLAACYNDAISRVNAQDVLVFVHDDVLIVDLFWPDTIIAGFQKFDIVGVAGNRRRLPLQTRWDFVDERGTRDFPSNLSGVVGQGREFPCDVSVFGPPERDCKLLDGVFLAVKKATLDNSDLKFDEAFGFHFYDLDFCRQAEERKLRMGTIPLSIVHEGGDGSGSPEWRFDRDEYLRKWRE